MEKNKVTTYLLYAIGEIVLVVIGILIAVSLNNWNQAKKDKAEERVLLKEVLEALKQDSVTANRNIRVASRTYEVYQRLYKVRDGVWPADSLVNLSMLRRSIASAMITKMNYPDLATRVMDHELKKKVQEYHQSLYSWEFVVVNYNNFIENNMRAMLREKHLLNYEFFEGVTYEEKSPSRDEIINKQKLVTQLEDEDLQQLFFEGIVKTKNLSGFIDGLNNDREALKEEIRRILSNQ